MCCRFLQSRRLDGTLVSNWSSVLCYFDFKQKTAYEIGQGVQTCALPISSRRRHTRLVSDWSSDVCSSDRSEEHTSELQSLANLVCRLLLGVGIGAGRAGR